MRKLTVPGYPVSEMEIFEWKNGAGPNVVITGAVHGNEQTGVHAAKLLMKELDKSEITGSIKIIPVTNQTAYYHRQRVSPYDELDMNRIFPGDAEGTLSLRVTDALWRETSDAEYIVDLHCCGVRGSTYTLADYGNFPELKEFCIALGMPVVCQTGGTDGQFYLESCRRRKQKAVIIELPGGQPGGIIDMEWAHFCADRLLNCLKYIKAVKGEYVPPSPATVFCGKISSVTIKTEGLFIPHVAPGDFLKKGDMIGHLDNEGEITTFEAPEDIRLVSVTMPKYVFVGETAYGFMPVVEV